MKNITRKELESLAATYGRDASELEDYVIDIEGDGIEVTACLLDDYLANGDL